jgi:phosphatidate cytidylyltransferase
MYYLPGALFSIVIGFFILAASWEWSNLIKLKRSAIRYIYIFILALVGYTFSLFASHSEILIWTISICGSLWWCYAIYELRFNAESKKGIMASMAGRMLMGYLILIPAWVIPVYIQGQGAGSQLLLLYLFLIVWGADSAAYFAGRKFGKNKLAPSISPGKTLEGLFGGLFAVVLLALLFGFNNWGFSREQIVFMMVLSITSALFSVAGDLTESRVKRIAGVKDSGSLFPGHGGVLDRIDAFTAAAPVFSLGWLLLGSL